MYGIIIYNPQSLRQSLPKSPVFRSIVENVELKKDFGEGYF